MAVVLAFLTIMLGVEIKQRYNFIFKKINKDLIFNLDIYVH